MSHRAPEGRRCGWGLTPAESELERMPHPSPLLALPRVVSRVGETPPLVQDCPSGAQWPASPPRKERLGSGWRKTPKWEAQILQALVGCKVHYIPFLPLLHWHRQLGLCAPGQSPKSPLRPIRGDTARIISQSKGPKREEARRPEGGERHLLWSQSSSRKQCGKDFL